VCGIPSRPEHPVARPAHEIPIERDGTSRAVVERGMVRRGFLLTLLALPACASRNVVWRRRSDGGVPHDAELWLWPVQSAEVSYRDDSIASLEKHLITMATREGVTLHTQGAPPLDAWSVSIRVRGLPIPPSDFDEDTVDASALVVIRQGATVTDVIEVNEEIRTYYSDYLPWRVARRITDVIALRRNGW
jgi:hypothetical protein